MLFYAGEIGDITEIIDACEKQPGISFAHVNLLHEMIKHAPYTQQIASEVLHERRRTARMSQLAEEEKEQEDAIEDEFTSDENEHDM